MSNNAKSSKKESGFSNYKDRKESGSSRSSVKAVKTKSGVEGMLRNYGLRVRIPYTISPNKFQVLEKALDGSSSNGFFPNLFLVTTFSFSIFLFNCIAVKARNLLSKRGNIVYRFSLVCFCTTLVPGSFVPHGYIYFSDLCVFQKFFRFSFLCCNH